MKANFAGLLCATLVIAQPGRELLLPEPRTVSISVVDEGGNPVADASVDHTGEMPYKIRTDRTGRVKVSTRAPAIVIRKAEFQSVRIDVRGQIAFDIVLRASGESASAADCSVNDYLTLKGWNSSFGFKKTSGVTTGRQGRDADYRVRGYVIAKMDKSNGITHGRGPNWSWGFPSDDEVWGSADYQEKSLRWGEVWITDARGTKRDGKKWRFIGMLGESASYHDESVAAAKILDSFMNGVCIAPRK